ncbi:MAG: hypothetical protein CVT93_05010 [Bacteroidetes bacterium HGW-Bacteroidetes-10]|nr:MAG: hypothetical protein CVT93_05010 [Bacteroidetes bacterium HGW-Bacteroidetes-10]
MQGICSLQYPFKINNNMKFRELIIVLFTVLFVQISNLELSAEDKYNRIVSLSPSITQSLYYLGVQDKIFGCTSYCQMAISDGKEIVSSAIKPNLEKIAAIKPDLVIASGFIQDRDIRTLRSLGIKVKIINTPKSFEEICEQFESLGELTGKIDKAREIVSKSRTRIRIIQKKRETQTYKPNIFIQIGASPVFTVIPGTFMNDYITFCGGNNIASNLKSGAVGTEFILSKDPDFIFVVTMGIAGNEEIKKWEMFKSLKAVKSKKIFVLESDIACQPTPLSFAETLEKIDKYISKK